MTLFRKKFPRKRRYFLAACLALLCLAPVIGALTGAEGLSARPLSQDVTELPGPAVTK